MSGLRREVNQLLRQVTKAEHGCTVQRTRNGHWKVTKEGRTNSVTVSHTPSDQHVIKNIRADLRRYLDVAI